MSALDELRAALETGWAKNDTGELIAHERGAMTIIDDLKAAGMEDASFDDLRGRIDAAKDAYGLVAPGYWSDAFAALARIAIGYKRETDAIYARQDEAYAVEKNGELPLALDMLELDGLGNCANEIIRQKMQAEAERDRARELAAALEAELAQLRGAK